MTREEAIAVLEESKRQNEIMRDNPSTFWASHQMAAGVKNAERRIAAIDMALAAITPPNEALTLEQLREMDGEPVWCCGLNDCTVGSWMLVGKRCCENMESVAGFEDYGVEWLAYRRPPEGEVDGK